MRVTVKSIRNATAALLVACLAIKVGLHPWSGATTNPHDPYVVSLLMNVKHLPPRNGADLAPGPVHVYVWERLGCVYLKLTPFKGTTWYVPIPPRDYFFVTVQKHMLLINKGLMGTRAPFFVIAKRIKLTHIANYEVKLKGDGYLVIDVSRIIMRRTPISTLLIPVVCKYNPPFLIVDGKPWKTYVGKARAVMIAFKKGVIGFGAISVHGQHIYVVFKKGKYFIRFKGEVAICWNTRLQRNVTFEDMYWRFQYWPYPL